jgi:hypothetical protein
MHDRGIVNQSFGTVRCFLCTLPMCETKPPDAFSPPEVRDLENRPAQSWAGFLAVKRALIALTRDCTGIDCTEADFVLGHESSGAPVLLDMPGQLRSSGSIAISVSHTRAHAYGLAVLEPGSGTPDD